MFRQLMDAIERMENRQRIEKINNELQRVNERLKDLAVRDTLTGLYNRQGFAEEMESLIHKVLFRFVPQFHRLRLSVTRL